MKDINVVRLNGMYYSEPKGAYTNFFWSLKSLKQSFIGGNEMKRFLMAFLSTILLAVLILSFQSTAFAATLKGAPTGKKIATVNSPNVTCSQNGCNGLDPVTTGCSATASTALSTPIVSGSVTIGIINLRYSSACGTNWAQVLSYNGTADFNVSVLRAGGADGSMTGYCAGVSSFCGGNGVVGPTYAYTFMVWAPDVAACAGGMIFDSNTGDPLGQAIASQDSSLDQNC